MGNTLSPFASQTSPRSPAISNMESNSTTEGIKELVLSFKDEFASDVINAQKVWLDPMSWPTPGQD